MHIRLMQFLEFKRFTNLTIEGLSPSARLVVLAGPNGSGKSSVFDGLKTWHWANGGPGNNWDETYGSKAGGTYHLGWPEHVKIEFHEALRDGPDDRKRLLYVRSAFRTEADFNVNGISRLASPLDSPRVARMIDVDASVSDNYQRLLLQTLDGVYDDTLPNEMTRIELRDRIIGRVRRALARVFPDLQLRGIGGLTVGSTSVGTFYFTKGTSSDFLYKNLSAGEKAVFDLILDATVKAEVFNDTVWCIDEPETHLNTRVQSELLDTLMEILPPDCQLFLASHSIGFMRKAWEMAKTDPKAVQFIDMQGVDFDQPVALSPVAPSREFWSRTLDVALGDLAGLMAPEQVVLCEGKPLKASGNNTRAEFDASCYRKIFAKEFPETDFISVGSSSDVTGNRLEAGRAIQTLTSGTVIIRLIDRDMLTEEEIAEHRSAGIRVLRRRHIESYLLDDEVLAAFCSSVECSDQLDAVKQIRDDSLAASVVRGNDSDDLKSAAGQFYVETRKLLTLAQPGSNWDSFARKFLAPLIQPGMVVYGELRDVIFDALTK